MSDPFIPEGNYTFTAGAVASSIVVKAAGEPRQVRVQTPAGSPSIYICFDGDGAQTTDMEIYGGVIEIFTMTANQTSISVLSSGASVTGKFTIGRGE